MYIYNNNLLYLLNNETDSTPIIIQQINFFNFFIEFLLYYLHSLNTNCTEEIFTIRLKLKMIITLKQVIMYLILNLLIFVFDK